jgi:hypothetical protein
MTDDGAALLARAEAGQIRLQFIAIAVGDGVYTEPEKTLEALQARTALKSEKNRYSLSDISVYAERSVKVTALITNQDPVTKEALVTEGYYINEIGLFAKAEGAEDETAVLYSIAVTAGENGDYMPPYNGYNPAQITQDWIATVNNVATVTIQSTGAALLVEDANKMLDDTTRIKYKIGIDNGLVYIEEVED